MKRIAHYLLVLFFASWSSFAQETPENEAIEALQQQMDRIEEEERNTLRKQVENINSLLENGVIDEAKARDLKIKAAEERTKRIDERQAVLKETMFFLESKMDEPQKRKEEIEILLDVESYSKETQGELLDLSRLSPRTENSLSVDPQEPMEEPIQQITGEVKTPTTVDLVFAIGLNNTVWEGISWEQNIEEETDYLFYSSRFFEIGLALKSPLEEQNRIRLKYGISYQLNELEPSGNRYFSETDGLVQLQQFPRFLHSSRFLAHNLVIPLHLEFGPTKLKSNGKGSYYSTSNKFKLGLGGYVGLNIAARQELEYSVLLRRQRFSRLEVMDDFSVNREVYGVSAYIGFGAFSLYGKYDLNTIFQNGARDEQFVSMGFRLDL